MALKPAQPGLHSLPKRERVLYMCISHDGRYIASADTQETLRVWDCFDDSVLSSAGVDCDDSSDGEERTEFIVVVVVVSSDLPASSLTHASHTHTHTGNVHNGTDLNLVALGALRSTRSTPPSKRQRRARLKDLVLR